MNLAASLSVLVAVDICTALADPAVWSQPLGFLIYTNDPDVRGGNRLESAASLNGPWTLWSPT